MSQLSTAFEKTREYNGGGNMDIAMVAGQFEETDIVENISMDRHYRDTIKNYGPERAGVASDEVRRNKFSRQIINLHHDGAYTTELPYRNDAFDMQFHDHDPRGRLDEIPWREARRVDDPKLRQRLFGKDADNSIPGEGIAPVDMVSRISELRRQMRSWNWFDESLDNWAVGRTGTHANTPRRVGIGRIADGDNDKLVDLVVPEDSSATVDPAILDTIGRRNVNRILSNNINTGGKYFISRTTTDHVVPVAAYGFLFKSYAPLTPRQNVDMTIGDQTIRTLGDPALKNKRNILAILDGAQRPTNILESDRYRKGLDRQTANTQSHVLTGDIMALMGVTANEIKYINSLETKNREAHRQCLANVVDMVIALDKLPPNAKLDIRARLLSARTPRWSGGTCDSNIRDARAVRGVLEARGRNNQVNGDFNLLGHGTVDNKFGTSTGAKNTAPTTVRADVKDNTIHNTRFGASRDSFNSVNNTVKSRGGHNSSAQHEPVADYSQIFRANTTNNKINTSNAGRLEVDVNEDAYGTSTTSSTKNRISTTELERDYIFNDGDSEMGREHFHRGALKSWNDSHLIPKQFKR